MNMRTGYFILTIQNCIKINKNAVDLIFIQTYTRFNTIQR